MARDYSSVRLLSRLGVTSTNRNLTVLRAIDEKWCGWTPGPDP